MKDTVNSRMGGVTSKGSCCSRRGDQAQSTSGGDTASSVGITVETISGVY